MFLALSQSPITSDPITNIYIGMPDKSRQKLTYDLIATVFHLEFMGERRAFARISLIRKTIKDRAHIMSTSEVKTVMNELCAEFIIRIEKKQFLAASMIYPNVTRPRYSTILDMNNLKTRI